MNTKDTDAMDDMQNATRALAEKIRQRAMTYEISTDGRAILLRWQQKVGDLATQMGLEMPD